MDVTAEAKAIRISLSSMTSCNASIVTRFRLLLGSDQLALKDDPANTRSKPALGPSRTAAAKQIAGTKARGSESTLTPKERYSLATDVVNITLKALTECVKSGRPGHRTSTTAKALREIVNPPKARNVADYNDSIVAPEDKGAIDQSNIGIEAVAECSRSAFAYLRTGAPSKNAAKAPPSSQLEQGVLVLIGKMIALGLQSTAIKELRALKRRFEGSKAPAKHSTIAAKETLATLLQVVLPPSATEMLPLVLTYHNHLLRIISNSHSLSIINAAVDYFNPKDLLSPSALILMNNDHRPDLEKTSKQLEALAQQMLLLANVKNSGLRPSAEAVLKLQSFAFSIRRHWWKLASHQVDTSKEVVRPLSAQFDEYHKRSTSNPLEQYELVKSITEDVLHDAYLLNNKFESEFDRVYLLLSTLARAIGQHIESEDWASRVKNKPTPSTSDTESSLALRRVNTLLEASQRSGEFVREECLLQLRSALDEAVTFERPILQPHLAELLRIRRNCLKILAGAEPNGYAEPVLTTHRIPCRILFECVKHLGALVTCFFQSPRTQKSEGTIFGRELLSPTMLKQFIEAVTYAYKFWRLKTHSDPELRVALDSCVTLLQFAPNKIESSLSLHISNLYWQLFQNLDNGINTDESETLECLKGSVKALNHLSSQDRQAGFFAPKIERLGNAYLRLKRAREACHCFDDGISFHINRGTLREIVELASTLPLTIALDASEDARSMHKLVSLRWQTAAKAKQSPTCLAEPSIDAADRRVLLEMQISQVELGTAGSSRDENFNEHFDSIATSLMEIDRLESHHIRQAWLCTKVLLSSLSERTVFGEDVISTAKAFEFSATDVGSDQGLQRFAKGTAVALSVVQTLCEPCEDKQNLSIALSFWQSLSDDDLSPSNSSTQLHSVDELIKILRLCNDRFAFRGEARFQVDTLELMCRVTQRQSTPVPCTMIRNRCELASRLVRCGLLIRARQELNNAESLLGQSPASLTTKLRARLCRLEIATASQDRTGVVAALSAFTRVTEGETAKKSERLEVYECQADAGYLCSVFLLQQGEHIPSLEFAKETVRLYKTLLATADSATQKAAKAASEVKNGVSVLVENLEKLVISSSQSATVPTIKSTEPEATLRTNLWHLSAGLFRSLLHTSSIYAFQGLRPEADYYAKQAAKLASVTGSRDLGLQLLTLQTRFACLAGEPMANVPERLDVRMKEGHMEDPTISDVVYHVAEGDLEARLGEPQDALVQYELASRLLQGLRKSHETLTASETLVAVETDSDGKSTRSQPSHTRSSKKSPLSKPNSVKTAIRARAAARIPTTKQHQPTVRKDVYSKNGPEETWLLAIESEIHRQQVLTYLKQGDFTNAGTLVSRIQATHSEDEAATKDRIALVRDTLAQVAGRVLVDVNYNALLESTLSVPSLMATDQNYNIMDGVLSSPMAQQFQPTMPSTKIAKTRKDVASISALLQQARERLVSTLSHAVASRSLSSSHQLSSLTMQITLLLSAVAAAELPRDALHPARTAYYLELPSIEALNRQLRAVAVDKRHMTLQELLLQHTVLAHERRTLTAAKFQREYLDILPDSWNAISISMNEECTELWLARYQSRQPPFLLRLPMARHKTDDLDDEATFDFEVARAELRDIIQRSDYTCHNTTDISTKSGKLGWWAEREALDKRMQELLANMENIWLGGFKGVLSQCDRQQHLLARFRKTFDNVLDRHLPSRQSAKAESLKLQLDSHVLSLFIELEGHDDETVELDDHVLDLLYFVVDLLQFNGEPNAYDEIDFDSMAIDTLAAMRAYHEARPVQEHDDKHTILILDKRLHAFPWESMPCLEKANVSRVGSMLHLRERILAMRLQREAEMSDGEMGRYHIPRDAGSFILNPGSDLTRTQETLLPYLSVLQTSCSWTSITNRAPSEKDFTTALSTSSTLLYFGHGSGNQYVRNRSIRKLDQCAKVVWLMGCSSGTVTENGEFEPVSVPLSYLVAGESPSLHTSAPPSRPTTSDSAPTEQSAPSKSTKGTRTPKRPATTEKSSKPEAPDPATKTPPAEPRKGLCMSVLATLWDVTDKDIDRFSVHVGQKWGLFASPASSAPATASTSTTKSKEPPKTPGKRAKAPPKTPGKTPKATAAVGKTPGKTPGGRTRGRAEVGARTDHDGHEGETRKMSLVEAVAKSRDACYLRYLNGAAAVVYGVPVWLGD